MSTHNSSTNRSSESLKSVSPPDDVQNAVQSLSPDQDKVDTISRYSTRSNHSNQQPKKIEENQNSFEVVLEEFDPENVVARMSYTRKLLISLILSVTGFCVTMISSVWSLSMDQLMSHFHIGREVGVLGISLYIFGLGIGPVFLSPISEFYGRRVVYFSGLTLTFLFEFIPSFSTNYGSILFSRFISGFFGSAFMSVAGGTFSDMFSKKEIYYPFQGFVLAPFLSPAIGAFISGLINQYSSFRWCFHVMLIFTGVCVVAVYFVPETYKPYLTKKKAIRIRIETGDDRYYAPLEKVPDTLLDTIFLSCKRPFGVLLLDPMMFCLCFYTGFVLAIVYMFFICLPYVFLTVYDFTTAQQGLSFISLAVGMLLATPLNFYLNHLYNKQVEESGSSTPEMRLTPMKYGVFLIPFGLMIIAWTSYSHVHWMGPICGAAVFGGGVSLIFTGVFTYTVDGYRLYSASALAANSFTRSYMAGVFPLFGYYIYKNLGVNWASFLLSMLGFVMLPMPFIFAKYGAALRSRSPYAWSDE